MRCAIYTRKSSTEGLEQPFNSLDAQRLACAHFIASQASEGWTEIERRYDDGGHSGATLVRPALKALLGDIQAGGVDMVVVYKIDRLSRSVRDFVHLLDRFESRNVTFASVTQQFSTNGSMGRLTLNILLSFAQFERDLTSERIRDKFAALRSKGMRPQGGRPFGYRFDGRRLVIDESEAAIVRQVFATFIRLGTVASIPDRLNQAGLRNHRGRPFTLMFVRRMLRNRLYLGDLVHRGKATSHIHPAIVTQRIWERARAIIAPHEARWARRNCLGRGMLAGLVFGPTGALVHEAGVSRGKVYRYYGPPKRVRKELPKWANWRFRADDLEWAVLAAIDPDKRFGHDAHPEFGARDFVKSLVTRVDIDDHLAIHLTTGQTIRAANNPWLKTSRLRNRPLIASSFRSAQDGSTRAAESDRA